MKVRMRNEPGGGICGGCRNGQVMQTDRGAETYCNNLMTPLLIRRPVVRCTDFEDRTAENEFEMRKIAWTFSTRRRIETTKTSLL